MFDANDNKLWESYTGLMNNPAYRKHEFLLEEDERIIGVRGRKNSDTDAIILDLQFVIGRLE